MSEKPPRRRWFRYSLRTLFVVVTLLCGWLAWESSVVRQRKMVLGELRTQYGFRVTTVKEWVVRSPAGAKPPGRGGVSLLRSWLGDEAISELWYSRYVSGYTDAELARLQRVFPEAEAREELPQEPCHPGCFPRGTLVETPSGQRVIESISVGESVTAILPDGKTSNAKVQFVFITDNRLWKIETKDETLFTTETQPLCVSPGQTLAAGNLKSGDTILRQQNSSIRSVKVLKVTPTDEYAKVYNLVLGNSEVFVAQGFLARSKPPATIAAR